MKYFFWSLGLFSALFQCTISASPSSINQRQSANEYEEEPSPGPDHAQGRRGRVHSLGNQVGFGPPIGFPTFQDSEEDHRHSPQYHSEEDYPHGGSYSNSLGPPPGPPGGPFGGGGHHQGSFHRPQSAPSHGDYPQGPNFQEHPGTPEPHYPSHEAVRAPSHHQPAYPNRPYHHDDPKKPIVLKVSRLKNVASHPSEIRDGPSVFYAPSPDVKYKDSKRRQSPRHPNTHPPRQRPMYHQNENGYEGDSGEYPPGRFQDDSNVRHRYRRALRSQVPQKPSTLLPPASEPTPPKKNESIMEVDPMLADGSEQDNFWDLSSPFIMFDTYKKEPEEEEAETSDHSANQSSGNVTFHDSNSEEQRFFPSFPSPYLGLSPFSSAPARAPLFPGPAANRAPSRYHPSSFGAPTNKYSQHPNRGPSTVAASHERYQDTNLLGSGNFEVVRGGTYYGDEDDHGPSYHHGGGGGGGAGGARPAYHEDDEGYYHQNSNGHSSPYRGGGGDFFANFRDFADINPHSRSFSHNHETHGAASELSTRKKVSKSNMPDMSEESRHQPQFSLEYDPMMATY